MLKSKFPKEKVPAISKQIQQFYFGDKPIDKKVAKELVDVSALQIKFHQINFIFFNCNARHANRRGKIETKIKAIVTFKTKPIIKLNIQFLVR